MFRILWMSDAPTKPSGFGIVTGEVCKRLALRGHRVDILGWWGGKGPEAYCGIPVRPCPISPALAATKLAKCIADSKPDFLITLGDIPWLSWVADDSVQELLLTNGTRWCLYYPVDGTLPDGTIPANWVRVLTKVDIPVTTSQYGTAATARSGVVANFIPHGCDTDLFSPPQDKEVAKQRFGYNGKFVVLSDVRNHRRKVIPRILDIIRLLNVPSDMLVMRFHTNLVINEDCESYSYNIRADVNVLKLGARVHLSEDPGPAGLSTAELAMLYSAADVHLLASLGEGFGLPTLQAASSGVVPIAGANSANIELLGDHGFAIPAEASTVDEFGILREFMDRSEAAFALQSLYNDPELLRRRSVAARRFALDFTWDSVAERWDALLRANHGCPARRLSSCPPLGSGLGSLRPPSSTGPGTADEIQASELRASGHHSSVLPLPRLTIPARLALHRGRAQTHAGPVILTEARYVRQLRPLEALFPGTLVAVPSWDDPSSDEELLKAIVSAMLVVDCRRILHPLSDLICALSGVNFLGKSRYWLPVAGRNLVLQARYLLTDYALLERRASLARRRAVGAAAAVELAGRLGSLLHRTDGT